MASLGLRHGAIADYVIHNHAGGHLNNRSCRVNLAGKLPNRKIFTAVNATAACDSGYRSDLSLIDNNNNNNYYYNNNKRNDRTSIEIPRVSDTFDEWMRKSVTEIVKNITQAPLLIQIYADGEVKTEKASPENDWKSTPSLEGVILVEELTGDTDPAYSGDNFGESSGEEDGVRAFGVLIQGKVKGKDQCKSTCYLLKTSSVNGGGLGFMCTHFCLMKVQSFHENVFSQFSDCWLVQ